MKYSKVQNKTGSKQRTSEYKILVSLHPPRLEDNLHLRVWAASQTGYFDLTHTHTHKMRLFSSLNAHPIWSSFKRNKICRYPSRASAGPLNHAGGWPRAQHSFPSSFLCAETQHIVMRCRERRRGRNPRQGLFFFFFQLHCARQGRLRVCLNHDGSEYGYITETRWSDSKREKRSMS